MNNLEYLNEISKSNRQVKKPSSGASTSLILKIALGGIVLFAIIIGLAALSGGGSKRTFALTSQIATRTSNLNASVSEYNKHLKTSKLRAIGTSLSTTLTAGSNQLAGYFAAEERDPQIDAATAEEEDTLIASLNSTLNNARLNGILDRIYASQLQLQVTLLLSLLSSDIERAADNPVLGPALQDYQHNLLIIEQSLKTYSNPGA